MGRLRGTGGGELAGAVSFAITRCGGRGVVLVDVDGLTREVARVARGPSSVAPVPVMRVRPAAMYECGESIRGARCCHCEPLRENSVDQSGTLAPD
jgi:hypothetical protein